jgi:hypothetical protein
MILEPKLIVASKYIENFDYNNEIDCDMILSPTQAEKYIANTSDLSNQYESEGKRVDSPAANSSTNKESGEKKKIVIKEKKREVLNHKEVVYNNNKYIVGYCLHNDDDILFIFDHEKKEDVITRKWHKKDNFISSVITDPSNKKTKQLHLHNFVIDDKENFIDHINKIGYETTFNME